jgi:hypothetical protein
MAADFPVNSPMFTNLLVRKLIEEAKTRPELEHAIEGTLLRHSDAGGCARKIGMKVAGYAPSDPIDGAGLWVMWLGSLIGEKLAEIACEVYGEGCKAEYEIGWDDLSASGHLDLLVDIPLEDDPGNPDYFVGDRHEGFYRICVEYKTMGGFGFDKSVGLNRKAYKLADKGPEGPRSSAKIQGALNALAVDADELRIGHISLEAVSKQLAQKVNWGDEDRILAEWSYPREVFEPWALREKRRMAWILNLVDEGVLPDRWVIGDDMEDQHLNPQDSRPPWQCSYCSFQQLCIQAGFGEPTLPLEGVPVP